MKLDDLQQKTADWRATIALNQRRTVFVIALFMGLYLFLGLLLDSIYYSHAVIAGPQGYQYLVPSVPAAFVALITLQLTPFFTLIAVAIAVISLFVTYSMYDRLMLMGTDYREVLPDTADPIARQLYNVVEEMKVASGMAYMPKVYIIEADYMNAFASGYSERSAMVAITRGLIQKLDRDELQAVMAHELSHIRHQDIKLTLTASVLSNLLLMMVEILYFNVLFGGGRSRNDERGNGAGAALFLVVLVLRFVLPLVTLLLTLYLSRTREYMADAGAVELMRTNEPMARALLKIHQDHQQHAETVTSEYAASGHEEIRRAAYIYDPVQAGVAPKTCLTSYFSTHPNITDRLRALGFSIADS